MNTVTALEEHMKYTLACCGLDPNWELLPTSITQGKSPNERDIFSFLCQVIDITAPHVCAYKAQKAFFDLYRDGHELLRQTIKYVHDKHKGIPVIVDCKIGDIGYTMSYYAKNIFENLEADGLVVNPYMGEDVFSPLMDYPDKAIVVLVKTSNLGGQVIQDIITESGQKLWEIVLEKVVGNWNKTGNMVPTLSSHTGKELQQIRTVVPDSMPILFAGVGSQGGNPRLIRFCLNQQASGVFVNSSRDILYPKAIGKYRWLEAIEQAIVNFKETLNKQRGR